MCVTCVFCCMCDLVEGKKLSVGVVFVSSILLVWPLVCFVSELRVNWGS